MLLRLVLIPLASVVNSLPVRSLNCSLNELVRFY